MIKNRGPPLDELVKPNQNQMLTQLEKEDYDRKYDASLLKSKAGVKVVESNMVTEETEKLKLRQPSLRKKIDHKRVSSIGDQSQASLTHVDDSRMQAMQLGNIPHIPTERSQSNL